MSYYDDYVAEGLCCECCGTMLNGDEPGFARRCDGCREPVKQKRKRSPRASTDLLRGGHDAS